jgi:hypothetical protein
LASLTLRIPTAGLLDQYRINCEQSDELLIIRSADFKLIRHHSSGNELFVRVGDLVPLGSPISLVSRSTCSGQIFKIDETFVYIRKGEILALRRNTKLIVPYGKIVHRARPIAIILADLSKVGSIRDITHTVPILSRLLELHGRRHRALTAILAPVAGYVDYADTHIVISDSNGSTTAMLAYTWVADNNAPLFTSGNYVDWLQPLTTGPMDYFRRMYLLVRRYLRYTSGYHACRHTILYTQLDLLEEIHYGYVEHDLCMSGKHFEMLIIPMVSQLILHDPGNTLLVPGTVLTIEKLRFLDQLYKQFTCSNTGVVCYPTYFGMTKAVLQQSGFLAPAGFRESSRVLMKAALQGKVDALIGAKESTITGRFVSFGGKGMKLENAIKIPKDDLLKKILIDRQQEDEGYINEV